MGNLARNNIFTSLTSKRELYINVDDILLNTTKDMLKTIIKRSLDCNFQNRDQIQRSGLYGYDRDDFLTLNENNQKYAEMLSTYLNDVNKNKYCKNIIENKVIEKLESGTYSNLYQYITLKNESTKGTTGNYNTNVEVKKDPAVKIVNRFCDNKTLIKLVQGSDLFKNNLTCTKLFQMLFNKNNSESSCNGWSNCNSKSSCNGESEFSETALSKEIDKLKQLNKKFKIRFIVSGYSQIEVSNKVDVLLKLLQGTPVGRDKETEIIQFVTEDGEPNVYEIDMSEAIYIDRDYFNMQDSNADIKILMAFGKETDYNGAYMESDIDGLYKVSNELELLQILNFAERFVL